MKNRIKNTRLIGLAVYINVKKNYEILASSMIFHCRLKVYVDFLNVSYFYLKPSCIDGSLDLAATFPLRAMYFIFK